MEDIWTISYLVVIRYGRMGMERQVSWVNIVVVFIIYAWCW